MRPPFSCSGSTYGGRSGPSTIRAAGRCGQSLASSVRRPFASFERGVTSSGSSGRLRISRGPRNQPGRRVGVSGLRRTRGTSVHGVLELRDSGTVNVEPDLRPGLPLVMHW